MKYRISIGKHQFEVRVESIHSRPILAIVDGETFEVWPEGQEATASAATAVEATAAAPPAFEQPFKMVVDRPFAFAIEHAPSGAILFMGSIMDPQ